MISNKIIVKINNLLFIVEIFKTSHHYYTIHSRDSPAPPAMFWSSLLANRKSNTAAKTGKINFPNKPGATSFSRPARLVILSPLQLLPSLSVLLLASAFPLAAGLLFFSGSSACCWPFCCCCGGGGGLGAAVRGGSDTSCGCNGWRTWRMPSLYLAVILEVVQFDGISNSLWKRCNVLFR